MYCKNCGRQISDSAPYCNFCGATVRVNYYTGQGAGSSGAKQGSNQAYYNNSSYAGSKAGSGAYWNQNSAYAKTGSGAGAQSYSNAQQSTGSQTYSNAQQSAGAQSYSGAQQNYSNVQQNTGSQGYSGAQLGTGSQTYSNARQSAGAQSYSGAQQNYSNVQQNAGSQGYSNAQQGSAAAYANVQGAAVQQSFAQAGAGYGGYANMNAQPVYGYNPGFAPVSDSGTYLKKEAGSPLFLTGVILFSVNALWGLIRCFFGSQIYSLIVGYFYDYLYDLGLSGSTLYSFFKPMQVIEGIGALPAIIMAVGMWVLFISAKDRQKPYLNSAGFTVMRVISIIEMVFFSLAMLACEIILVIVLIVFRSLYSGYSYYGAASSEMRLITIILLVCMIVIAGIAAVYIIYYAKLIGMLSSMKGAAAGRGGAKLSIYVAVISFIGAVSLIYSAVSSFSSLFLYIRYRYSAGIYYITSSVSGIAALCGAAAAVILGIILIKNRKKI